MKRTWMHTIAALALTAATLTLTAGCTEDGPGSVADVPAPEPGDPAIYAPDGWPLQIGDKVSNRWELGAQFPSLGIVYGINVVNGRTYGARWGSGHSLGMGFHDIYEGHFPITVSDVYWQYEKDRLPEHLHGRIEYHEAQPKGGPRNRNLDKMFIEHRERMRAEGLLPTPAQRSPERKR